MFGKYVYQNDYSKYLQIVTSITLETAYFSGEFCGNSPVFIAQIMFYQQAVELCCDFGGYQAIFMETLVLRGNETEDLF